MTPPFMTTPGMPALNEPKVPQAALPAGLLAQVRRIQLRARRLVTASLSGEYRSVFRGAGIEFAEAREYVPGDDVRLIDWNVTARMGEPWVKEYVEERELSVVCAVDISASALAARPEGGRLAAAAEVCALLSLAAAANHDRAGLLTFSDRIERFVAPERGTRHALRIVREVLHHEPAGAGTSVSLATDYLARVLRRRSIVFLISDLLNSGYEPSLRALARRHEVIAITLTDPGDQVLPDLGLVELEDIESGARLLVDSADPAVRARYRAVATTRTAERAAALAASGVEEVAIDVTADALTPVVDYIHRRAAAGGQQQARSPRTRTRSNRAAQEGTAPRPAVVR